VDTITVGLDTPWAVVFEEGSEYLVTRDGQVVTVNDLPVEGTVTSIVTRTFTVTGANFDPTVITDGAVEKNGLRAATIEIVGGTGIGQMRVIESSTDDSITVTTPWRTELDDTSEFVINRYHGLALPSVTVRVEDNDAAGVVITQTADSTDVMENSLAAGTVTEAADAGSTILTDSTAGFTPDELTGYVLVTGGSGAGQIRAIDSNTSDTITVVSPWSEALDDTSGYRVVRDLAPWTDTYSAVLARMPEFPVEVTIDLLDSQILVTSDDPRFDTDSDGKPVLTFNATNWDAPVILTVLAADDSDPEGFHHGYIAHTVLSADVDVPRESTDSFPALADEPQTSVMLMHDPSSESITVKVDGVVRDADRYELSSSTVIFLDEDGAPEEVKGEVSVTYSYLVPGYDGVEVDRVVANVGDDDAPGVLITESDGSTDLIEITDRQGLITGTVQPGADRLVFGDFGEQDLVGRIIQITDGEGVGQSRIIEVNSASEALVDEAWDVPPDGTSTFEIVEVEALTGSIDTAGNWLFISDPNPYFRISGVADLTALIGMTVEITGGAGKGQTREITQIKDYPLLGGQYIIVDSDWDVVPEAGSPYRIVTDEQILLSGAVDHGLETVLVGSFDYDDLEGETITITTSADEVHTNTVVSRSSINGLEFLILEDEWSLDGIHEADSEYEITITLEGVPWDDSYTVTLTKEAVGEVWVTVKPEITKTTREKIRYDNIQVIVEADPLTSPDAQSGTVVERFDGVDITIPFIKLRFDSTNWNIPQTVNVKAIDDPVADGGDTKVFAPRLHTVNDIMGPLFLQGAGGQGSLVGLTPPVLLPENPFDPDSLAETNLKQATGEIAVPVTGDGTELVVHTADIADYDSLIDRTVEITQVSERGPEAAVDQFRLILKAVDNGDGTTTLTLNDPWDVDPGQLKYLAKYAITNQSLNFFVDEDVQVDFLTVYHDDSVANNTGSLMEANEADRIRGYDQRIAGMGMGPDIQIGGELRPGGITFGTMEIAVINLGSGKDTFNVQSTHNRDDFTTWTMLNTGAGDDTVNVSLEADEQLTVGVAEAATGNTLTSRDPATLPGGESPAGYAVLITSGPGAGQMRAITAYDFATDIMTVNRDWTVLPEGDSQFAIVNRGDGAFTLDTQEGNDTVLASGSTLPLIIFGGDGSDTITGGQGDDVIFGDRGRVDYLDESGDNIRVVTRLGSAPENLTGSVTDAGNNSLVVELDEYLSIDALPTEDEGLRGLVVWINEGKGAGQSRLIVSNTGNVITVDTDWSVVPDATSGFRITGFPSDQTDEMIREASFLFSSDPGVGGDDIIWGGMGEDVLIGGAGGDAVDGGSDADLLFGDNVKLDRTEGRVDDYTYPRFRALSGSVIYDAGDQDQVDDSVDYTDPAGIPAWANWDIVMNEPTRFDSYGGDYIAGGSGSDMIFGQLGDDTIQGDGAIETGTSVPVPPSIYIPGHTDADPLPLVFNLFEAVTDGDDYIEGNGGADTIYGGLGQDDLIGGSSDLFSLVTPELRPDGSDIIFGGNGTRVDRNDLVTETNRGNIVSGDEHSRDADMILGDNGNIFRLVDPATGQLLAFNYDSYGSERIIPRAARLLDYSPGGPDYLPNAGTIDSDIGAADEVHGESGDDFIYGTAGDDALYGDAGDDDLIGGYGNDWISGGTGQDGILGDDGRIWTSRNGLAEPLNGIEAIPASELDLYIATGGDIQNSVINITGQLKKTANLTPFKLGDPDEPQYTPTYDPLYADDIIYGGWGSDFIHGGDGDDAVSGAEALPEFYAAPVNPGDVLGYDPVTGEFAAYDENDPWHKVEGFLLNFDPREGLPDTTFDPAGTTSDGDDVIFGDLGHDWIVGGTGRDHLYGGRGDDLLNADDDHDSGGVTNREPDADPTYEDIAYGGAGRDRLLANTGGDRLIDWAGEFNSYIVPFSPFGIGTVSRQLQPAVMEYLYQLSASDGADPTRAADEGSDPDRNGEPYGELGLVKQQDPDWQDQTGGPDDPQPGNDGGSRDVLRTAAPEDPTAAGTVSDPSSGFETLIFDETTGTFYDPNLMTGTAPVAAVTTDPSLTPEAEDWIVEV
jgi:Ca2+-binding RTX toxin-like protein